ncbi:PadR family transcriptional regulator [Paenibacillus radicis (ex Gao et al. 2016)]|uniref:PadR family transcriptional regulator n=1 Tax=Paenibacillus radicis (ex Gao et al. 2016) TaxID=1737354 RepID=A0A917HDZ5_9BACL|nr:PadR family transcriptional regulator [Paenibacillus radicis (ex Gao et al. 2016)]GGG76233.1 PadR family transcriptional regulator [Paenibacillus radicis (ex Gao et al. 2016)]
MSEKLLQSYLPMSETAYYILLSLTEVRHGYGIMQDVGELTGGRIHLGAGTLYGSLSRMEKDGLIAVVLEEERRKSYQMTAVGRLILKAEITRISELYHNAKRMEGKLDA